MNNRTLTIAPGDISAAVTINDNQCSIDFIVKQSFLELQCKELEYKNIAATILQYIIEREGIFVAGNPNLKISAPLQIQDWNFSATFPILPKPTLNRYDLVEELRNCLHEDDLDSIEECKKRLISIVESKITYQLPQEFLVSTDNPVNSISVWKEAIALSALADIEIPGVSNSITRNERGLKVIEWILAEVVKS